MQVPADPPSRGRNSVTFGWGPKSGLDAVKGRKIICLPPGIEFQFLSYPQ